MIVLDEASAGRAVDLSVGQAIELRLKENPTTGFTWHVARSGAPACRIQEDRFEALAPSVPGQPGTHAWVIEGVAAGTCIMEFAYSRAWNIGVPPASTYTLTVHVGD